MNGMKPILPTKLLSNCENFRLLPSTIYKNSKNIERTLFWWATINTRTLSKNVKIDPQEYVIRGPPPIYYLQKLRNIERTLFWWTKIKTQTLSKNVKIDPQEYVYKESSPNEKLKFIHRW